MDTKQHGKALCCFLNGSRSLPDRQAATGDCNTFVRKTNNVLFCGSEMQTRADGGFISNPLVPYDCVHPVLCVCQSPGLLKQFASVKEELFFVAS